MQNFKEKKPLFDCWFQIDFFRYILVINSISIILLFLSSFCEVVVFNGVISFLNNLMQFGKSKFYCNIKQISSLLFR